MPIYECSCEACGITFEILAPVSEANRKRPCPRCARPSPRVASAFAIGRAQPLAAGAAANAESSSTAGAHHSPAAQRSHPSLQFEDAGLQHSPGSAPHSAVGAQHTRAGHTHHSDAGHAHHANAQSGRRNRPTVPDFARLCWMDDRSAERFAAYKLGRGAEYDDKAAAREELRKKRGLPLIPAPDQNNSPVAAMVARKKAELKKQDAKTAKGSAPAINPH